MKKPSSFKEQLVLVVGTAFGLGLAPVAPGSFAALLGVAIHALLYFFAPPSFALPLLSLAFVICCVLHFWLNDAAAKYWDDTDSGNFVLDEVAGYLVTAIIALLVLPADKQPVVMVAGFLLFRVIDIIKIEPARYIDRNIHSALGVILDDLIAGAYAALVLWVAHQLWHVF